MSAGEKTQNAEAFPALPTQNEDNLSIIYRLLSKELHGEILHHTVHPSLFGFAPKRELESVPLNDSDYVPLHLAFKEGISEQCAELALCSHQSRKREFKQEDIMSWGSHEVTGTTHTFSLLRLLAYCSFPGQNPWLTAVSLTHRQMNNDFRSFLDLG